MVWLCDDEKGLFSLFDRRAACDGQTVGRTSCDGIVALCIASRGKNWASLDLHVFSYIWLMRVR